MSTKGKQKISYRERQRLANQRAVRLEWLCKQSNWDSITDLHDAAHFLKRRREIGTWQTATNDRKRKEADELWSLFVQRAYLWLMDPSRVEWLSPLDLPDSPDECMEAFMNVSNFLPAIASY